MNPQEIRRKYAEMLRTSANLRVGAIVEAFARVPRSWRWPVRVVASVGICDCAGARDPTAEAQLRKFLSPDAPARIHVLSIEPHIKGDQCMVHLDGFCLQT
jgi:hypothetical protein